jgi:glycosyltransferase involved in cell wall biosynthesis/SAM-dependent methyltransferase
LKPQITFLADKKNWAFSYVAQDIITRLKRKFRFDLYHLEHDRPNLSQLNFDLLYVFFWGEKYWKNFTMPYYKVLKEVASFRWRDEKEFGNLSPEAFCKTYLNDCNYVTSPCLSLAEEIQKFRNHVMHTPNGIDPRIFKQIRERRGKLRIGWAGNPNDPLKGLHDILKPAVEGKHDFIYTNGTLSRNEMVEFYNQIDVLAISSLSESQPLPLMEAMACGCYAVTTDVGIVPEIIKNESHGIVVSRDTECFVSAFQWCDENIDYIRNTSKIRSQEIRETRNWDKVAKQFEILFFTALDANNFHHDNIFKTKSTRRINVPEVPNANDCIGDYFSHLLSIQGNIDQNYTVTKESLYREVAPLLPIDKYQLILEIGSGFGYFINLLLDLGYKQIIAADISKELIETIRRRFADRLLGAYWCNGNAILSCNRDTFDLVILFDVIEHIPPDKLSDFLHNLRNSLNEGGRVILRTPNMALPLSTFSRYIDLTHQNGFTEFSIRQAFLGAGFSNFKIVPQQRSKGLKDEFLFRLYRYVLRKLFILENRTMPTCFEKNLLVEACK